MFRFESEKFEAEARAIVEKQFPFAASVAMNATAKRLVQIDLPRRMERDLDEPIPFSKKAFRFDPVTKQSLESGVEISVKDIQNEYLRFVANSEEFGSRTAGSVLRVRGDKGTFERLGIPIPVAASVNQYGNFRRNQLARLIDKAFALQADHFIGSPKIEGSRLVSGGVRERSYGEGWKGLSDDFGIYKRQKRRKRARRRDKRGRFRKGRGRGAGQKFPTLLVRFSRSTRHDRTFDFLNEVARVVDERLPSEFEVAFEKAMASRRG